MIPVNTCGKSSVDAGQLEGEVLGKSLLFLQKEKEADSVFSTIEKEYLRVKELAAHVTERPTVLSGIVYGDAWFLPGGRNYAASA